MVVGLLIDGTVRDPIPHAGLLIDGGRILKVGAARDFAQDQVEIIDYSDKTVMPGLIDTHVHLEFAAVSDNAAVRKAFRADSETAMLQLRALHHAQLALCGGVTTVRDCGSSLSLFAVRDAIIAGLPGPRLLVSGPPITTTGGHMHWAGFRADTAAAVRVAARRLVELGADAIKIMASGGHMTESSNPFEPQYSAAEVRAAVEEGHRLGRRVVAHALNVRAIEHCFEAGVDAIDHCYWHLPDGTISFDVALAKKLARSQVIIGLTASWRLRRLVIGQHEGQLERLRQQTAQHRALYEDGARIGLHSDAGVQLTRFDRFDQSLTVMMAALGITPAQAIVASTRLAAANLGLDSELGTLEPGKQADMIALNGNPLESLDHIRRPHQVIRGGRVLVNRGGLVVGWSPPFGSLEMNSFGPAG